MVCALGTLMILSLACTQCVISCHPKHDLNGTGKMFVWAGGQWKFVNLGHDKLAVWSIVYVNTFSTASSTKQAILGNAILEQVLHNLLHLFSNSIQFNSICKVCCRVLGYMLLIGKRVSLFTADSGLSLVHGSWIYMELETFTAKQSSLKLKFVSSYNSRFIYRRIVTKCKQACIQQLQDYLADHCH